MSRFIHHVALTGGALVMVCGLAAAAPLAPRMSPGMGRSGAFATFTPSRALAPAMSGGYVIPNTMNRPIDMPGRDPRTWSPTDVPGRDPRTWSPTDVPGRDPRTWSPYPLYPPYRPYPYSSYDYWLLNPYWRDQIYPQPYPYPYPVSYSDEYPDYFGGRSSNR